MLNRRSFLKACGVGVVAPSLVALGGTTFVPEVEVAPELADSYCTPLVDLFKKRHAEMDAAMKAQFESQFFANGPTVKELNAKGVGFFNFTPPGGKTVKCYYEENLNYE